MQGTQKLYSACPEIPAKYTDRWNNVTKRLVKLLKKS